MKKYIKFLCCILIFSFGCVTHSIIKPFDLSTFQWHADQDSTSSGSKDLSANSSAALDEFLKTTEKLTVTRLHSGDIKVKLSNVLNLKHPLAAKLADKQMLVPIFAYLLYHEKHGYFLVDTGTDSSYLSNPYGRMTGSFVRQLGKTTLQPNETIEQHLGDLMNEINLIFFTHLHFDHTAGVPVLPEKSIKIIGKNEKPFSIKGILETNHFKEDTVFYELDFDSDKANITPIGKAIDLFGDKSFWAISTPGHSKGHVSYLANTERGTVLITGDALTINQSLETGVGPGDFSQDVKIAQSTFEKIRNFHIVYPQVKIWPGHDNPLNLQD